LLTDVLRQFRSCTGSVPGNVPGHRERLRVGAWIIDGRFVVQRLLSRTRPLLSDLHEISVRVSEVIEPAVLVEPARLDDERVLVLPAADRVPQVGRIQRVAFGELAT